MKRDFIKDPVRFLIETKCFPVITKLLMDKWLWCGQGYKTKLNECSQFSTSATLGPFFQTCEGKRWQLIK